MDVSILTWCIPDQSAAQVEQATLDPTDRANATARGHGGPEGYSSDALAQMRHALQVPGIAYLATCQRVMWVVSAPPPRIEHAIRHAYQTLWARNVPAPARYDGIDALAHLTRVAASLDAFVPGEPQILGQVRDALRHAMGNDHVDREVRYIFDRALHIAKDVRTKTGLFQGNVSLLPLTTRTIEAVAERVAHPTVAIIGTGLTGQQALQVVRRRMPNADFHVVSRSSDRASHYAETHGATGHTLDAFRAEPPTGLDLILTALPVTNPCLDRHTLARWAHDRPLTVIDLALPRNTERPADPPSGLHLVQMDELGRQRHAHLQRRADAYQAACTLVDQALSREVDLLVRRQRGDHVQRLHERFTEVAERRWASLPNEPPTAGSAARKWYEQTVRALLHEAIETVTEDRA